jgi:hypothetical protein
MHIANLQAGHDLTDWFGINANTIKIIEDIDEYMYCNSE